MKIPFQKVKGVWKNRATGKFVATNSFENFFSKSTVNCKVDWNLFELIFHLKIVLITRRLEDYFIDSGV